MNAPARNDAGVATVAVMGLGPVGLKIASVAAQDTALRLVAAIDPKPELAGRSVGALIVEGDAAAALRRERPDIVLHATSSFLPDAAPQLRQAIAAGASVVSTCEELSYPFHRHPDLARELDAAAAARGVVLLGAGVNPGFVMDGLIVTMMSACSEVRRVRASRVVDAATRREPLQRKIGAGITPEEFARRAATGRFGHIGLPESAWMVADALMARRQGPQADLRLHEELRPVIADRRLTTPFLVIEPGQVAGLEQVAAVSVGGDQIVRLDLTMAVGAGDPADTITIDGTPPIDLRISGGIHGDEATAAVVVSAARKLLSLRPGLRTVLDLPPRM